jgi:hypothetical protein
MMNWGVYIFANSEIIFPNSIYTIGSMVTRTSLGATAENTISVPIEGDTDGLLTTAYDDDEERANGWTFLAVWLGTASLLVIAWFVLLLRLQHSVHKQRFIINRDKTKDHASTGLLAYVVRVEACSAETLHAWQDLLQWWATRPPCLHGSRPMHWEHTTVKLLIDFQLSSVKDKATLTVTKNPSCLALMQAMLATWEWLSERPKLCFAALGIQADGRLIYPLDSGNVVNAPQHDADSTLAVFVGDVHSRPLRANWLNHLARIAEEEGSKPTDDNRPVALLSRTAQGERIWHGLFYKQPTSGKELTPEEVMLNLLWSIPTHRLDDDDADWLVRDFVLFGPEDDPDALFFDSNVQLAQKTTSTNSEHEERTTTTGKSTIPPTKTIIEGPTPTKTTAAIPSRTDLGTMSKQTTKTSPDGPTVLRVHSGTPAKLTAQTNAASAAHSLSPTRTSNQNQLPISNTLNALQPAASSIAINLERPSDDSKLMEGAQKEVDGQEGEEMAAMDQADQLVTGPVAPQGAEMLSPHVDDPDKAVESSPASGPYSPS